MRREIEFDEVVFAAGLVCVTVGLWQLLGLVALIAPGTVLIWLAMPTRKPFIAKTDPPVSAPRP